MATLKSVVGFTGTRAGMSAVQQATVAHLLAELAPAEVHHGDCIGSDSDFDAIAKQQGIRRMAHPCTLSGQRAFCNADAVLPLFGPLERNRHIVAAATVLIATPGGFAEEQRSGTWATIREARRRKRRIIIVWPDGTTTEEGGK